MKTPEEGYTKGWADAIYAYESKQKKNAVAAERDCRTCANFTTQTGGCMALVQCTDADQFKPTVPRRYWAIQSKGETLGNTLT